MSDLLPCPFCGGTQLERVVRLQQSGFDQYRRPLYWEIVCDECDLVAPPARTKQEAVDHWNTRYRYPDFAALNPKENPR